MSKELMDSGMILMWFIIHVIYENSIFKVEVCDILFNWISALAAFNTVRVLSNRVFPVLHQVACKSSCFIWENIVNLTELLIEVACLYFSREISFSFVDVCIPLNKLSLKELDDFQGHNEGDRNEIAI